MPVESWLYFIIGFMIFASIVALEITDLLSAVVSVGMVGLGLSVAFLFLQAPDLALVQFVFEIISVIFLILLIKLTGVRHETERSSVVPTIIKLGLLVAVVIFMNPLFLKLQAFGEPLMDVASKYLTRGASETGSVNLVTSVILDYRAYDTLGEATVLFVAILGVATILRRRGKGDEE